MLVWKCRRVTSLQYISKVATSELGLILADKPGVAKRAMDPRAVALLSYVPLAAI